jgi:hypothetical protein
LTLLGCFLVLSSESLRLRTTERVSKMTVSSQTTWTSSLAQSVFENICEKPEGKTQFPTSESVAFCWPRLKQTLYEHRSSRLERDSARQGGILCNL